MKLSISTILSFFCLWVVVSGCEKNRGTTIEDAFIANQPKSLDIDINNDTVIDFRIDYKWLITNDYPTSGKSLTGYIQPLNGNEILYKRNIGNLFLQKNDTIFSTSTATLTWNKYQADLVVNNGQDSTWSIISPEGINNFYLGLKLKTAVNNYIGWMKIAVQSMTGEISIVNKKLSEADFIIIGE